MVSELQHAHAEAVSGLATPTLDSDRGCAGPGIRNTLRVHQQMMWTVLSACRHMDLRRPCAPVLERSYTPKLAVDLPSPPGQLRLASCGARPQETLNLRRSVSPQLLALKSKVL